MPSLSGRYRSENIPIFISLILQQLRYDKARLESFLKVNVISESAFTVQGHGVHTAFTETIDSLKMHSDWQVTANSRSEADVIHIHTIGPYSLRFLLWGKGSKVVSAHVTPDSFVGSLVGAKYWHRLASWYLRWFYNRADGVLAVSNDVVKELKQMGVHRKIYLVPNTIRTQLFTTTPELRAQARKKLGIAADAFVVLGAGQVQPRKRIDVFLDTAKRLPSVQFIWAGGIPFKQFAANSRSMDRVMRGHEANLLFTGQVTRDEIVAYFHAADLFFFPSEQETFGLVIVEAAAAGLPLLLRDLDQYKDTFGSGYEKGNDDTFASIIDKFKQDKRYYDRWVVAAQEVAKKYDAEEGARTLLNVYRDVLSKPHSA
jgi:1,2-diacylglycerol-3-alpha-glucose alpha-1,2-galactosyltransferase